MSRSRSSGQRSSSHPSPTGPGQAALERGDWEAAFAAFQGALAGDDDPADAEGLGLAAWWLDRSAVVFDARERAYRRYREIGDVAAAARVAVWIGWDYLSFKGESAVARGWFGLARQLLAERTDSPEFAWLSIRESMLVLFDEGDPPAARRIVRDAIDAAKKSGSRDYELLGLAVDGLAQVTEGRVGDGMQQLDAVNAALIAGEMTDRVAIGLAGCYLIAACDRVRDYDRAAQWCDRIKAFCAKWGLRPLFAVCRTQYAAVCMWHGEWDTAERELLSAVQELALCRPGMTSEGAVRLGELRRRQGRNDEARTLFEGADGHPMATVGLAAMALDRGDATTAADLAERHLRQLNAHNRTERVTALDIVARARLAIGRNGEAKAAVDELTSIATATGSRSFHAVASLSRGIVAAAAGDLELARRECEDAVDHFKRAGSPFEAARARLELAAVLKQAGRIPAAVAEAERAIETLTKIAAQADLDRATRLMAALSTGTEATDPSGLTRRELEVLRLVAKGLSNQRIAAQLFISEHTVHRHVANTFSKLGVSSRSAAVAQAARLGLLGS